jgi:hypothetical protein
MTRAREGDPLGQFPQSGEITHDPRARGRPSVVRARVYLLGLWGLFSALNGFMGLRVDGLALLGALDRWHRNAHELRGLLVTHFVDGWII